jgi:hypothetical protein
VEKKAKRSRSSARRLRLEAKTVRDSRSKFAISLSLEVILW